MLTTMFTLLPRFSLRLFLSLAAMPIWLQMVSYVIPLRYFLIIVRGIVLKGVGLVGDLAGSRCAGDFAFCGNVGRREALSRKSLTDFWASSAGRPPCEAMWRGAEFMHPNPRRILPVLGIPDLAGPGYYLVWPDISKDGVGGLRHSRGDRSRRPRNWAESSTKSMWPKAILVAANQNVVSVQPSNSTRGSSRAHPHADRRTVFYHQSVEPGEFTPHQAPFVTVADLDRLTSRFTCPKIATARSCSARATR